MSHIWDAFMFKVLMLQVMHPLSDERAEYLIKDRLSFMRFLGLGLSDPVPDANTIWNFRETLKWADAIDALFARFDVALRQFGYLAMSGQIIDASISQRRSSAQHGPTARLADAWGYAFHAEGCRPGQGGSGRSLGH